MAIIRITKAARAAVCSLLCMLFFAGCCTVKDKTVEEHSVKQHRERVVRDSIFCRDSIVVRAFSDTVYVMRERTLYRDHLRTDTLWRCDTIFRDVVKEVRPADGGDAAIGEEGGSGLWYMALAVVTLFILWRSGVIGLMVKLFK